MVDIPLGTTWLGCYLVYKHGKLLRDPLPHLHDSNMLALQRQHYDAQIRCLSPEEISIWIDEKNETSFGLNQYRRLLTQDGLYSHEKNHNFSDSKSQWLNSEYGLQYLRRIRSGTPLLQDESFGACSEFIIQGYNTLKEVYSGSSILIIGGGPSANDIDWNSIKTDHIWTCNKFYDNPKFQDIKVDYAVMAPHMELLDNKNLMEYLERHPETSITFETERGCYEKDWQKMYNFILNNFSRSFVYGVRYRSQLGITSRQICLAIFLGFKDIYIVGFDGQSKANDKHAFEGKKEKPKWFLQHDDMFEIRQLIGFWEYICELKNKYDFNIINLAEDLDYNLSSEITKWLKSNG